MYREENINNNNDGMLFSTNNFDHGNPDRIGMATRGFVLLLLSSPTTNRPLYRRQEYDKQTIIPAFPQVHITSMEPC